MAIPNKHPAAEILLKTFTIKKGCGRNKPADNSKKL